jgi:hypothetical protein
MRSEESEQPKGEVAPAACSGPGDRRGNAGKIGRARSEVLTR